MGHLGYDFFTPDPGTKKSMKCRICDSVMDVRRKVYGPTGFAEAMAGGGHNHDEFRCPHTEEDWHKKALRIVKESNKTSSDKLAKMLRDEAQEIVDQNLKRA